MNVKVKQFISQAFRFLPPIIETLDEDNKKLYSEKLSAMQERLRDPEFRLAVVGDFSCGKSTFLNALIGEELLTADILPTTAIPTYIRWNKENLLSKTARDKRRYYNPIITLTMSSGKTYTLTKAGKLAFEQETHIKLPDDTGAIIDTLTTTTSLIGKIARVDLTFREKKGYEKFCLVDTPGINPGEEENREHILQTQKVLREEADAIVLLYSAKDAMTRSTEEFMKQNAGHLMGGAIIILTKMDLVPKKQLEKIFNSTKRLVKDRFHQEKPNVYGISAQKAIEYRNGIATSEEDAIWAKNFGDTMTEIISRLDERRMDIISQRISNILNELIKSLSNVIMTDLEKLEQERALLAKASVQNLQREFDSLCSRYGETLNEHIDSGWIEINNRINSILIDRGNEMLRLIDKADSSGELNDCLEKDYPRIMSDVPQKVEDALKEQFIAPIEHSSSLYAAEAVECLKKYDRYLGDMNTQTAVVNVAKVHVSPLQERISATGSFLDSHAATVTATALSVLLTGGIGILFLAGGYVIDIFRLDSKKDDAREKVKDELVQCKQVLTENIDRAMKEIIKSKWEWAQNLLEEYRDSYLSSFEEIERAYRQLVRNLEEKIKTQKTNVSRLEELRKQSTARLEVKDDTKA